MFNEMEKKIIESLLLLYNSRSQLFYYEGFVYRCSGPVVNRLLSQKMITVIGEDYVTLTKSGKDFIEKGILLTQNLVSE